ncbi:hypothetical protein AVEN_203048-1 [Araneus ventricosus]|uniref:Uncharacterized protein n=1 Tax=Araneus ventricosus TaxID=182803 RepID=A0A4Y2GA15_ARAVE|nr:hypothetical protein AVEN_203048-1 [Araneus ventricosus]
MQDPIQGISKIMDISQQKNLQQNFILSSEFRFGCPEALIERQMDDNVLAANSITNVIRSDLITNVIRSDSKNQQGNGCFITNNVEQNLIPSSELRFSSPEILIEGKLIDNELVADSINNNARPKSRNPQDNGCFTTENLESTPLISFISRRKKPKSNDNIFQTSFTSTSKIIWI